MTNQEKFESELGSADFKIDEQSICSHEIASKVYCYYKSECTCCDILDFTWYKRLGCKDCVFGSLDSLECGGHYGQLRIFRDGKEIHFDDDNNIIDNDTNGKPVTAIESKEERLISYINEFVEDMDLTELTKLTTYLMTFREIP